MYYESLVYVVYWSSAVSFGKVLCVFWYGVFSGPGDRQCSVSDLVKDGGKSLTDV